MEQSNAEEFANDDISSEGAALLSKAEIRALLSSGHLVIRPMLEESQVGMSSIDFRLGSDFLVSIQGREAYINASLNQVSDDGGGQRNIYQFFQATRRQLGETFILHPHQTVLASSLEYVKLPDDCLLSMHMRSSYNRLGINVSTITQPGYCGCLSLELTNNNNNPINLAIGARIVQGILFKVAGKTSYFGATADRKYLCQVRPEPSAVIKDKDLEVLRKIWDSENFRTP